MKLRFLNWTAAALLAGVPLLVAQTSAPADPCPTCPTGGLQKTSGVQKKDGTGPKYRSGSAVPGQGQNPQARKKTGPRDGTGPIHTPSGTGRRGGRK